MRQEYHYRGPREQKRIKRLHKLVKKLREEGPIATTKDVEASRATRFRDLYFLEGIGVAKKIDQGWAWVDYMPDVDKIVNVIEEYRKTHGREPEIEDIAIRSEKAPNDESFRKALSIAIRKTGWEKGRSLIWG